MEARTLACHSRANEVADAVGVRSSMATVDSRVAPLEPKAAAVGAVVRLRLPDASSSAAARPPRRDIPCRTTPVCNGSSGKCIGWGLVSLSIPCIESVVVYLLSNKDLH
jgi:hypothetical protein